MLGILADDAYNAFSLDYLAINADGLNRCSNFHIFFASLSVAIENPTSCKVIRRELHKNSITGQNLNVVHPDLARDMCEHFVPTLKLHLEHRIGQVLNNCPLHLDALLLLWFV